MMLKVLKVVKKCSKSEKLPSNCGLVYPWEWGGGLFTTSSIRAGVYSVSALNREIIRKPDPYHSLIKTNGAEKKGRQISN